MAAKKKFVVLSCEVFRREFEHLTPQLPHDIQFGYQPFGLHDTPHKIAGTLQEQVDQIDDADAILIGYGLCSRGYVGLTARSIPLVAPRAHDCITVFLGSRDKYMAEFAENPGTYYYSPGWVDHHDPTRSSVDGDAPQAEAAKATKYAMYVEKYGEDNAKYLLEMEASWTADYGRLAMIDTGVGDMPRYRSFVEDLAAKNDWNYAELEGTTDLMFRFLNGDWNDDFLIVPPGHAITDTVDTDIIRAEELTAFDRDTA